MSELAADLDKNSSAVVDPLLDSILSGDEEILRGAAGANVDIDDLRSGALGRRGEATEAATVEANKLRDLSRELEVLKRAARRRKYSPPLYLRIPGYFLWLIAVFAALNAVGAALKQFFDMETGPLWLLRSFAWINLPVLLVVVGTALLIRYLITLWNRQVIQAMESSPGVAMLTTQIQDAHKAWIDALQEKGWKSILRDEINNRNPSYSDLLTVERATGLAEMHDPLYVIKTRAQAQIESLIESMPGGSIGLSGPRGAGKTTLLRHFCSPALQSVADDPRMRVLLSAPVRYDPREFVIHLFASICQSVMPAEDRAESFRDSPAFRRENERDLPYVRMLAFPWIRTAIPMVFGWGLVLLGSVIFDWKLNPNLQPAILLLTVSTAGFVAFQRMKWRLRLRQRHSFFRPRPSSRYSEDEANLIETARALLFGLAYQQSVAHGWSGQLKLPVGLEAGVSSNITMTEKPMGFPELVDRLNEFVRQVSRHRPVFIGIDELDKIDSDEQAHQFLNDIKGVFGLEECYYFISISENALSSFERRGLPVRDAFDSAFDVVVTVTHMDFAGSRRLLQRRIIGMPIGFMCLCHAMSGGLPRDLIRTARDLMLLKSRSGEDRNIERLSADLVSSDVLNKLDAVRLAAQRIDLEPDVGDFIRTLHIVQNAIKADSRQLWIASRELQKRQVVSNSGDSDTDKQARTNLQRLRAELAAYFYFTSTVMTFFARSLNQVAIDALQSPMGTDSIDQLARARQLFAESPGVAWLAVSDFRRAWGMPILEYGVEAVPNGPGELGDVDREDLLPEKGVDADFFDA